MEMVPRKLSRTESFPFKMMPHPLYSSGPTFHNGSESRSSDLYEVAGNSAAVARTLQPFPTFKSPGVGMGASLRFPFTSAQWQELERQALIYKYMMASVPVPPDLLISLTRSLSGAAPNLGRESCFKFNLRFSNSTDPEPGRCRRTDGKKWRCSRDVAPDQKYCDRHMHRGRPRSRKPVELQTQNNSITRPTPPLSAFTPITTNATLSDLTTTATTTTTASSHLGAKPYRHQPSRFCAKPDFKLSYQSVVSAAQDKEEPRYMDWMKGPTNPISTGALNAATPILQSYEDHLNLNYTDSGIGISESPQNSDQCSLFLNTDLASFEHPSSNQRQLPRRFIDAWSTGARENTTYNNKSSVSSLTLSMSGVNGTTDEGNDKIEMGLSVRDSGTDTLGVKSEPLSWMTPVSWLPSPLGGPLGEVLQSSATAGSTSTSPHGCSSNSKSSGGGLNLMCDGWGGGGEGASPRETSPRLVSSPSPTAVLRKTLASLSDSSSSSSPTFAAAKSKMALEWLNQAKLPSSS